MKIVRPKRLEETPSREKKAQTDSKEKVEHEMGMARKTSDKNIINVKLQFQGLNVLSHYLREHESVC